MCRGAQIGLLGCGVPAFQSRSSITFIRIVAEAMTLGLPQVCELKLWVSKGILPVKHLATNILMAVNNCGSQLAQMLGRAAPANHKTEAATPHHGTCKLSLQYDGRHDERFGVWVGMWNLVSLRGKG